MLHSAMHRAASTAFRPRAAMHSTAAASRPAAGRAAFCSAMFHSAMHATAARPAACPRSGILRRCLLFLADLRRLILRNSGV